MSSTGDIGYGTLSPIPPDHRRAQVVLTVCSMLSLVSAAGLWLHISYCLITWKGHDIQVCSKVQGDDGPCGSAPPQEIDLTLGLEEDQLRRAKKMNKVRREPAPTAVQLESPTSPTFPRSPSRSLSAQSTSKRPPLLILIHNLLLADVFLAGCYLENIYYLSVDAVDVTTPQCQTQGWMITFAVGVTPAFVLLMGLYTHLVTIRGYKMSARMVGGLIASVWIYGIACASLGPIVTRIGGRQARFFDRQLLWCWMNGDNKLWRLITYIPGYSCAAIATTLYAMTFWSLWRQHRSAQFMAPARPKLSVSTAPSSNASEGGSGRQRSAGPTSLRPSGHHPAFLAYPFVFVLMCVPLCIGDPIWETDLPFMATAGALMALSGLVDAIIWSTTMFFLTEEAKKHTGLLHFQFIRTPSNRTMGNMVWVQGGRPSTRRKSRFFWERRPSSSDMEEFAVKGDGDRQRGIQMETFVTVVVEEDQNAWKSKGSEERVQEREM